jgi:hypothetical protein
MAKGLRQKAIKRAAAFWQPFQKRVKNTKTGGHQRRHYYFVALSFCSTICDPSATSGFELGILLHNHRIAAVICECMLILEVF